VTRIGIDFSLNSPATCIRNSKGDYIFISFFNFGDRIWDDIKKMPKAFQVHQELIESETILGFPYYRDVKADSFLIREREKLEDCKSIANLIVNALVSFFGVSNTHVSLEGFSYGSTGNSFIDIVQYNSFLRSLLLDAYGSSNMSIFQPSHVKKTAGKGNANKHYMIKAFQDDVFNDKDLRNTKLWKYVQGKDFSAKIPKPLDDLVDSYFILNSQTTSN
jgi:hypothetical protein